MNRNEYTMLGRVLVDYRDAVDLLDGCLTTAIHISSKTDMDKAESIEACRIALMQSLDVVEGMLEDRRRKDS